MPLLFSVFPLAFLLFALLWCGLTGVLNWTFGVVAGKMLKFSCEPRSYKFSYMYIVLYLLREGIKVCRFENCKK